MSRDEIYLELCRAVEEEPFYVFGDKKDLEYEYFSNAYRLFLGIAPQLEALVLMCDKEGVGVSDYEKFEEICSAFPMLVGSTVHSAVRELLTRLFDLKLPINKENAPAIWRAFCGDGMGIGGREIMNAMDVRCVPVCQISSVPKGVENTDELCAVAENLCQKALDEKGILSISLSEDFEFVKPSVYGVNTVLAKAQAGGKISERERDMLTIQSLRSLMPIAKGCGLSIHLSAKTGGQLASLLEYLNGSVGLANILLVAKNSVSELKKFIYSLPPEILECVLPAGAEEASSADALRGYMHVFPIERLPHLGFLSSAMGFENIAEQCALRRSLCMLLADALDEDELALAKFTVRQVCGGNICAIQKGENRCEKSSILGL